MQLPFVRAKGIGCFIQICRVPGKAFPCFAYLTTAAGENIDPKTLQSMAGHADHQVTMNVYVHAKKENVARAGQMMDELLGNYAKAG